MQGEVLLEGFTRVEKSQHSKHSKNNDTQNDIDNLSFSIDQDDSNIRKQCEVLAEETLLTNKRLTYQATARTDCICFEIDKVIFGEVLESRKEI